MHWIRENSALTACASVEAASVFASPGTLSSSTWPSASRVTNSAVRIRSWPTTRLENAVEIRSIASLAPVDVGGGQRGGRLGGPGAGQVHGGTT